MNLREALARALASIDLRARVRVALAGKSPRRIVAIGKAAGAMVDGALDACGESVEAVLVVLPDSATAKRDDARVRVMRGSHPLPDAQSVAAGRAALAFDADLALISGGASALAFVPMGDLDEARGAFTALLASGADVRAINTVRRHASLAHGGRLGIVDTFIASDVIGGEPHDIGGGPTVPDPTTLEDARAVLARYAPSFESLPLAETVKAGDLAAERTTSHEILVGPNALAVALARDLTHSGLAARVLAPSTADVNVLAAEYADLARSLTPGSAVVRSAEPSVRIDIAAPGRGGRCTHLAALVARDLPPRVIFLAAASDGVDGASETAGALVTCDSFPDRQALHAAIATFDTAPLHVSHATALPLAPSGINLADVHVLFRFD